LQSAKWRGGLGAAVSAAKTILTVTAGPRMRVDGEARRVGEYM
jgi:hypothetical protein